MRILHIGKYYPPYAGGMENYLRNLVHSSIKAGMDVDVLVHEAHLSLAGSIETMQSPHGPYQLVRSGLWARLFFTPFSPAFPITLGRILSKRKPDLIHVHMPNVSAFWLIPLRLLYKQPIVVHWHADVVASTHSKALKLLYRFYRPFEAWLLRLASTVIATSTPYLESSEPLQGFHGKCRVIPLGLDPSTLQPPGPTEKEPADANGLKLLAIGRLTYYKGFDVLISAVARCPDVQLNLVGSGDRSEKIRTYNFPDGRVTDHRINLTLHRLPQVMTGELDPIIDQLIMEHQADLLSSLGQDD